jgi:acyl-CoA thioesterase-1
MTHFFALQLFLLTTAAAQIPDSRPVILAFGDSITAGYGVAADESYPAQLQKELDAKGYAYRVVNQGVSGSSTAAALGRLPRALAVQPHIVILQFGGNDPSVGISADATRDNLRKMIARFKTGGTRVILAGRVATLDDFVERDKVDVVYLLEGLRGKPGMLLSDGVHPTAEGYALVVRNLLAVLEPIIRSKLPGR